MYKRILILTVGMAVTMPAYAQTLEKVGRGVTRAVTSKVEAQATREAATRRMRGAGAASATRATKRNVVTPPRTSSIPAQTPAARTRVPAGAPQTAPQRGFSGVENQEIDLTAIEGLVQEHGALAAEQEALNTVGFGGGFGKSVLFAPVESEGKTGGFSVTAVEVDGEIFGVIASHVLPESYYTFHSSLQRNFHVSVKQPDGSERLLDAEVLQISPRSMLDISLVKFSPEAEDLIHPLTVSDQAALVNEELLSPGFAAATPQTERRRVQKNSFLSVRTDQNLVGDRQGFCGSPLLDATGQVKAIHTGTKETKANPDISYGTHARFIRLLVEAYHNDGQAFYDLVIDGHTLAQLNVDEYISAVYLYDSNGKRLLQKNIEEKFSESLIRRALADNPQTAYVQLTSRKAQWETDADGDSILKEDRSRNDKTKRQHWYNVKTKQMELKRPSVIKM